MKPLEINPQIAIEVDPQVDPKISQQPNQPANLAITQQINRLEAHDFDAFAELLKEGPGENLAEWSSEQLQMALEVDQVWGTTDEAGRLNAVLVFRPTAFVIEILNLRTRPDCRRQGLMAKLLLALIALRAPGQDIWLEVHAANEPAQNLYKSLGFHEVGRRPSYYRDGGEALSFGFLEPGAKIPGF